MSIRSRRGSLARAALSGLLLTACLSACDSGTAGEAEALVGEYLAQVADGGGDRGWSLLHPVTQEAHFGGDQEAYIRQATAEDWSTFDWRIGDVERDDPGRYEVVVLVDHEPPALISQLATWMAGPSSPGPTFYILFDGRGGSGIYEPGP